MVSVSEEVNEKGEPPGEQSVMEEGTGVRKPRGQCRVPGAWTAPGRLAHQAAGETGARLITQGP